MEKLDKDNGNGKKGNRTDQTEATEARITDNKNEVVSDEVIEIQKESEEFLRSFILGSNQESSRKKKKGKAAGSQKKKEDEKNSCLRRKSRGNRVGEKEEK